MEKNITCFFTGHRDIPRARYDGIYRQTCALIEELYARGYRRFICGGAVGFDTLAARAVIALREKNTDIRLWLCLPCRDQAKYFSGKQKEEYEFIKSNCDRYEILYEHYVRGCMHARNRRMVDSSSAGIAFCESERGGTAYTVNYAISHGVEINFVN